MNDGSQHLDVHATMFDLTATASSQSSNPGGLPAHQPPSEPGLKQFQAWIKAAKECGCVADGFMSLERPKPAVSEDLAIEGSFQSACAERVAACPFASLQSEYATTSVKVAGEPYGESPEPGSFDDAETTGDVFADQTAVAMDAGHQDEEDDDEDSEIDDLTQEEVCNPYALVVVE